MPNRCRRAFLALPLLVGSGVLALPGCASWGQRALGVLDGAINDPSNRALRKAILGWGGDAFCRELRGRSVPLTTVDDGPTVGRFFPKSCDQRVDEAGDLFVEFAGEGYAFTNVTRKVVFWARAAVQYRQDFLMDGPTLYAYFRTRSVEPKEFRATLVEQPLLGMPVGALPWAQLGIDTLGRRILDERLRQGFTVVREADGRADFGPGIVPLGSRPYHPLPTDGTHGTLAVESLRAEVHQGEREILGPITIQGSGKALVVRGEVDGAPALNVFVLGQADGAAALELYLRYPRPGPLPGRPWLSDTLTQGRPYKRALPLPEGMYYVVFDNSFSASGGPLSNLPANPTDDRAASLRYALEIGDAP